MNTHHHRTHKVRAMIHRQDVAVRLFLARKRMERMWEEAASETNRRRRKESNESE